MWAHLIPPHMPAHCLPPAEKVCCEPAPGTVSAAAEVLPCSVPRCTIPYRGSAWYLGIAEAVGTSQGGSIVPFWVWLCLPRPPLRLQIWLLELAVEAGRVDSLIGSWVMNLNGHSCLLSLYNVEALGIQG